MRIPKGLPGAGQFASDEQVKFLVNKQKVVEEKKLVEKRDAGVNDVDYTKAFLLPALRVKTADGTNVGTCSYGTSDGYLKTRNNAQDVCHARLGYCEYKNNVFEVVPHVFRKGGVYEGEVRRNAEAFYTWFLSSSPWAHCFITKDGKEALDVGVIYDSTQDRDHVVSAAIAMRAYYEHSLQEVATQDVFEHPAFKGKPGMLYAYILMKDPAANKVRSYGLQHTAYYSCYEASTHKRFLTTGSLFPGKGPAFCKAAGAYSIDHTIFGKRSYDMEHNVSFHDLMKKKLNGVVAPKKFGEAVDKAKLPPVDNRDFPTRFVEAAEEIMKGFE